MRTWTMAPLVAPLKANWLPSIERAHGAAVLADTPALIFTHGGPTDLATEVVFALLGR